MQISRQARDDIKKTMKISTNDWAKTLYEMTKGKSQDEIDGVISDFVKFLAKKKQMGKVEKIIEKFSQIWNKENKTADCEIISLEKLDEATIEKVRKFVGQKYQVEKVNIENRIDVKLKGGVVIKVGDDMLDASISGQLRELRKQLVG